MKKSLFLLFSLLLLSISAAALAKDRIEPPESCEQCGMSRVINDHSRMVAVFADGTRVATCSLHCMAGELKMHRGKNPKSLKVADYFSHKLIDAKRAVWVIGGSKQGVMTATPKWAFVDKGEAKRFIAANGGRLATFEEALSLAEKEE